MQGPTTGEGLCGQYQRRLLDIRGAFATGASGAETVAARAAAVDELILGLWTLAVAETPLLGRGIALLAVGGYGRRELFPYSDVDLLYMLDGKVSEAEIKQPIRRISQQLWDCGIRAVSNFEKTQRGGALRRGECRVHRGPAGPQAANGRRRRSIERTDRGGISQDAGAGEQGAGFVPGETDRGAAHEVWGHALPSGAEHQGLSRRAARCACVRLVEAAGARRDEKARSQDRDEGAPVGGQIGE